MILRQKFAVAGIINDTAYDDGLKSTDAEKKKLLSISIVTNGMADNDIQGWHERAQVFNIPDRLIDVEVDAFNENEAKPGARINEIEVGIDIPAGEAFKVAIKSGATAKNIRGTYNYEISTGA